MMFVIEDVREIVGESRDKSVEDRLPTGSDGEVIALLSSGGIVLLVFGFAVRGLFWLIDSVATENWEIYG